jgi:hypothetical protein
VGFEQMLRRRHINAKSGGRGMRFLLGAADLVRWPFERSAWAIERHLLWPLREQVAGRGSLGRHTGAAALAAIVVVAVLVGVLLLPGGSGGPREQVAAPARVAAVPAEQQPPAEKPQGPVLQGVPPDFNVSKGTSVAEASTGGKTAAGESAASGNAGETSDERLQSAEDGGATSSSLKPVPAGPAAMKVARRFSQAFVFYEIGKRPVRAKAVFDETATPQLATALGERPPRLPADAKVPRARVVNLVPGPRAGSAYTDSVSLLRVGLTSELRLELNKKKGQWLVTDVRG